MAKPPAKPVTKSGAQDDTAFTTEDTTVLIAVLANDTPPGGNTVVSVSPSKSGAIVSLKADGRVFYDPTSVAAFQALAQGEKGTDTFTYTQKHGNTLTTANVTVTLTGVNDAPTIAGTVAGQKGTDTAPINVFSTAAIKDVDHGALDGLTITLLDSAGKATDANGKLTGATYAGVGTYTLAPAAPDALSGVLKQVQFVPTAHEAAAGTSVTTKFSLAASDGFATVTDTISSVDVAQTAVPPAKLVGYNLTLITVPNAFTNGNDIDKNNVIVGHTQTPIGASKTAFVFAGFVDKGGNISSFTVPGAVNTDVTGENDAGDLVGTYNDGDPTHANVGFVMHNGFITSLGGNIPFDVTNKGLVFGDTVRGDGFTYDIPTDTLTSFPGKFIADANDNNVLVGSFSSLTPAGTLREHGFIIRPGEDYIQVDIGGANVTATSFAAVNNLEHFAGHYTDENGTHTFLDENNLGFKEFVMGQISDLNDNDFVVGSDSVGSKALVYANGKVLDITPGGAFSDFVEAINNSNNITGTFNDAGIQRGFFGTPVFAPPP